MADPCSGTIHRKATTALYTQGAQKVATTKPVTQKHITKTAGTKAILKAVVVPVISTMKSTTVTSLAGITVSCVGKQLFNGKVKDNTNKGTLFFIFQP